MDEWLKCQGKWLYLEPIFSADEIMKQIPTEGQAFKTMDAAWHGIMERVKLNPLMMDVASLPGLLEEFLSCNRELEVRHCTCLTFC